MRAPNSAWPDALKINERFAFVSKREITCKGFKGKCFALLVLN